MKIRESCLQTGNFIYKPGISLTKPDFHLQRGSLGLQRGFSGYYLPLKDLYGEAIDDNYNLSNGNSYIFITLTIVYKDGDDKQIEGNRNVGVLYAIKDDMERIQENSDCVYIDNYWLGGDESDVYHYVLGKGEGITSELGYIIQDEGMPEDTKCIYYCIEGKDSKTNDTVKKYFKLEL